MRKTEIEEALKKRFPERVALVVVKDEKDRVDLTPISWFSLANTKPRAWMISLEHTRYAHEVVSKTKEFVLCFPASEQIEDCLYCGSVSGRDVAKLEKTSFETLKAEKTKAPLVKDSIACFECKMKKTLDLEDHTIFVGEIISAHISEKENKVLSLGNRNLREFEN